MGMWKQIQDTINLDREIKVKEMKETSKKPYTKPELFVDEGFMVIGLSTYIVLLILGHFFWGIVMLILGIGSYGRLMRRLSKGEFVPWWTKLWKKKR